MSDPTYGQIAEQNNVNALLDALGDVSITDAEHAALRWLAGWEAHAVRDIAAVIGKARRHGVPTGECAHPSTTHAGSVEAAVEVSTPLIAGMVVIVTIRSCLDCSQLIASTTLWRGDGSGPVLAGPYAALTKPPQGGGTDD